MCKKGFCQSRTLAVHKMIHQEGSPHKCDICKKVFNQRSNLKTHMRTHTDEKPYVCKYDDCGKEFRRNCDLRRHNLTHTMGSAVVEAAALVGAHPPELELELESDEEVDVTDEDEHGALLAAGRPTALGAANEQETRMQSSDEQ